MLVLTRRPAEAIFLDFSGMTDAELLSLRRSAPIKISVVEVRGDKVKMGFVAPSKVRVQREEIFKPANLDL